MTDGILYSPTVSKLIPYEVRGGHGQPYFVVKESKAQRAVICEAHPVVSQGSDLSARPAAPPPSPTRPTV